MGLIRRPPATKAPAPAEVGANAAKSGATVSGVFLQTSTYATPVGLVYGSARIAPNLVQLVDLVATKAGNQKKVSMKGLGAVAGYNYTAAILLSLCQGPIAGVGVVWQDRQAPVLFNPTFTSAGWSLFTGTSGQSPWSYMTTNHPAEAIPYDSVAYVAAAGVNLPSDNLSSYSFLVQGFLPFGGFFRASATGHVVGSAGSLVNFNTSLTQADDYFDGGTVIFTSGANVNLAFPVGRSLHASGQVQCLLSMPNAPVNGDTFTIIPSGDASPADIVPDLLQNVTYGLGISSARFASLTAFQNYCAAAGLFCSPSYDTQQTAAETIEELLTIANTALVWSDGLFKFIPYGDTTITGNGFTFTPNTSPLYALTDDDYLTSAGTDPIKIDRKRPADAYNRVTVMYEDNSAASGYASSVAEAQDLAAIEAYGIRDKSPDQLSPIRSSIVAQQVAQLILQRQVAVRNTYTFGLGWNKGSLLEPMDLLELNDQGLGLVNTPVRVTAVAERPDERGFDVTAEDWPNGIATAVAYPLEIGTGYQPNTNVDPGATASPVIFEGPRPLASSPLEIWIGASGGPAWGGCDVYLSTDNVSYTKVGSITQKANFGLLTTNLLSTASPYPPPDGTNTLAVDLTASEGALVTVSATDFAALRSLCYVAGSGSPEFLGYETATLTSAEHYNLTTLARGLYGTTPGTHTIGDAFVFCDLSLLRFAFPQGFNGQTLYFKFPAWNVYGVQYQDLSAAAVVTHVIGQPPNIVEPALAIEITQLTSAGYLATFTVTVHDPTGQLATCTVTPTFQGLALLNNTTLGLPAAAWTATIGTPYTFTAFLQAPSDGGGYVKFHATQPSWYDAWATWYTAATAQDASPSTVIAIGNNQSSSVFTAKASATVNAPSNTDHILWLASTTSQPSQAAVVAGGAFVGGGGPFTIADLGVNLNLGDRVYLSAQPVDTLGRFSAATFIVATKVRESINASKTATFSLSSFVRAQYPLPTTDIVTQAGGVDYVQAVGNVVGQSTPQQAYFTANFTLPDNCVITGIAEDMYASLFGLGSHNTGAVFAAALGTDLYGGGSFAGVTAPSTAAWSTQSATCSQSTTGNRFLIAISLITNASIGGTDDVRFRAFSVTYTSANTQASL